MIDKRRATGHDRFVGERLKRARTECDMSQERVAEALDISYQQLQKYEKGINRLPSERMALLAKLFKKPITYFFR